MNKKDTVTLLREYIDYLLENSTAKHPAWNIENIKEQKPNKWNYIDGCMITAILALHDITKDEKYLNFACDFTNYFVNENGTINTYDILEYNLDNIKPASNLYTLYQKTNDERYLLAMHTVRAQLETMPRTKEGNFWHKQIYPNQVWLDGLYMAQPFYMQFEQKLNNMNGCKDSFLQFENVERLMKDSATGLLYHGYDESRQMYWADKKTGLSSCFWLRALGWYVMALVDTLEVFDEQMYYEYRTMQKYLKSTINSILVWQQANGMFYQLIDKPELEGNYYETSGTAIIAYAILKAVRLGYIPKKYRPFGEKAFYGTAQTYLTKTEANTPVLGGICLVAGLGGQTMRDGSAQYYLSEPVVQNEAKGVAPLLLALTELMRGNI